MRKIALVDNDVLIKGSCYGLLQELTTRLAETVGILGTARFVVASRLTKSPSIVDRTQAKASWDVFLRVTHELEPTADETELATSIEEAAVLSGVELDTGESQLCAIAILRSVSCFVSGDKRAIIALESLREDISILALLAGSITCLEQIVRELIGHLGSTDLRARICGEPLVDRSLSICFSCNSPEIAFDGSGLDSYIEDLRRRAPTMLTHLPVLAG